MPAVHALAARTAPSRARSALPGAPVVAEEARTGRRGRAAPRLASALLTLADRCRRNRSNGPGGQSG